jgi:hypothetical protein
MNNKRKMKKKIDTVGLEVWLKLWSACFANTKPRV